MRVTPSPLQVVKIDYTKHAKEKFILLKKRGWNFTKAQVNQAVISPKWLGLTKLGERAAMIALDEHYILRVIYVSIGKTIRVITFHPARKGRYETRIQQN